MAETIRLTQIDGKLPNRALLALNKFYRAQGYETYFTRDVDRTLFEPSYSKVFASTIFDFSKDRVKRFLQEYPEAVMGGTGWNLTTKLENMGIDPNGQDWSIYPDFKFSMGYLSTGCRLKCSFCSVSKLQGKIKSNLSIYDLWRPHLKRSVILLDNDYFGQPDWREKSEEIIAGGFKVNFCQGINIRLINEEACSYLVRMKYYDTKFKNRRIYTAWDNKKDEKTFKRGIGMLNKAGVHLRDIMVYMLCGYWKGETFEDVFYRFNEMLALPCSICEKKANPPKCELMPYPMVYDRADKNLCAFQRWVNTGIYRHTTWKDYRDPRKNG